MTPLFSRIARDLVTPESTALEAAQIETWLGRPTGAVLDVGCGWGRHAALMKAPGRRVIGVDRYVGFAPEVTASGAEFWANSFHNLDDYPPGTINAAYSFQNSLFDCSPGETLESLRGVGNVLKPGAKLLMQNTSRTVAAKEQGGRFQGVQQRCVWNANTGRLTCVMQAGSEQDEFSIYCYTRESMALLLELAGFSLVRWEDDGTWALALAVK